MIVAGVDEAGRGSVLGPLVIAGISISESELPKLMELGVKDSKLLSAKRRQSLYKEIKKVATSVVHEKIAPPSIDKVVFSGRRLRRLNYLEAKIMAKVLSRLNFDLAYVDCCDTDQKRFGFLISDLIAEQLGKKFTVGEPNPLSRKIKSEHHADRNYAVVSAASIIAKVTRDSIIRRLHEKHGKFGSGYPSDPDTVSFLKESYERTREFPAFARMSWLTIRRMQGLPELVTERL
ncbi:MAG: ribonuclease HII [Nitrososphaerota archaeon]|nr:ribonuclease HII [Nitrososphaerota archaeon]